MPESDSPLMQVKGLNKSFPGVRALHQVDLTLNHNEVLAVIGENGAGKSTLMKILAGVQGADAGKIEIDGEVVSFENTRAAMNNGVVLIHQELNLCDNLNVGANIFLGREPGQMGFYKRGEINRRSIEFLKQVGLEVSPKTIVGSLTIGRQQMVEIAKALSVKARILIMDEPTSSLSAKESESLFELIESLREQGVSIIYISHRLGEVKRLADRVVVLRDGENAGELAREEINHDAMVRLMVGREIEHSRSSKEANEAELVLEAIDLVTPAWPQDLLSLKVRRGEIVGIAGLVGAGRTELLQTLFGVTPARSGSIRIEGKQVKMSSPEVSISHGVALVPENRKEQGLIIDFAVKNNIGLPKLNKTRRPLGFADFKTQQADTTEMRQRLDIKTSSDNQIAKFLSGGNQQKVVIGKWLAMNPKVLLLDEPTRGIDVGAKQEIYKLIEKLAAEGMAILFVSSELEEVLRLADRTVVMHEGKIMGELESDKMNEESIMTLATGNELATV